VVERSRYGLLLQQGYDLYSSGDVEGALQRYSKAAEMGFDVAQINVAWLYDTSLEKEEGRLEKAFEYFRKAAEQKSAAAHLKMGDYYYYGMGTKADHNKAAAFYRVASEMRSPQATFNLGYMHQHGLGIPQDFYLAKRYYDLTADYNPDAYVPALLALFGLLLHFVWHEYHTMDTLHFIGYAWDTWLILLLSFALVATLLLRHRLMR